MSQFLAKPSDPFANDNPLLSIPNFVQVLSQKGPLAVLAAAGSVALFKGLVPIFEPHQAIFGASLLLVAALSDMVIWIVTFRTAQRHSEQKDQEAKAAADAVALAAQQGPKSH